MGTDDKLPDGRPAPAPVIYDIDGIINPASTVTALHGRGQARRLLHRGGGGRELLLGRRRGCRHDLLRPAQRRRRLRQEGPRLSRVLPGHPVVGHRVHHRVDDRPAVRGQGIRRRRDRHRRGVRGQQRLSPDQGRSGEVHDHPGRLHARPRPRMVDQESRRHRRHLCHRHVPPGRRRPDRAVQSVLVVRSALGLRGAQGGVQRRVPPGPLGLLRQRRPRGFNGARFNLDLTGVRKPCQ